MNFADDDIQAPIRLYNSSMTNSKGLQLYLNLLVGAFILIVPTILAFMKMPTEAGVVTASACLLLAFLNISLFETIKMPAFEAKMIQLEKNVDESEKLLKQIEEISIALTDVRMREPIEFRYISSPDGISQEMSATQSIQDFVKDINNKTIILQSQNPNLASEKKLKQLENLKGQVEEIILRERASSVSSLGLFLRNLEDRDYILELYKDYNLSAIQNIHKSDRWEKHEKGYLGEMVFYLKAREELIAAIAREKTFVKS